MGGELWLGVLAGRYVANRGISPARVALQNQPVQSNNKSWTWVDTGITCDVCLGLKVVYVEGKNCRRPKENVEKIVGASVSKTVFSNLVIWFPFFFSSSSRLGEHLMSWKSSGYLGKHTLIGRTQS